MSSQSASRKTFIAHVDSLEPSGTAWIQGLVTRTSSSGGLRSVVIDDGTGVILCTQAQTAAAPLEDLQRADIIGKYVQIIGSISLDREEGQARLTILKFWILDEPNLESLWFTEIVSTV